MRRLVKTVTVLLSLNVLFRSKVITACSQTFHNAEIAEDVGDIPVSDMNFHGVKTRRRRDEVAVREERRNVNDKLIVALHYVAEVEQRLRNKSGCSEVETLNISFDQSRWKKEAMLCVQVANLITALWRVKAEDGFSIASNATFLFNLVRANVLASPAIFGSVICFAPNLYRDYGRFCPYAYRDEALGGRLHVFDIAAVDNYDYSVDPNAIWWSDIRDKASKWNATIVTDFFSVKRDAHVGSNGLKNITVPLVTFDDGVWTQPYFDCFGGKVWMVTYLAPVFNETNQFL